MPFSYISGIDHETVWALVPRTRKQQFTHWQCQGSQPTYLCPAQNWFDQLAPQHAVLREESVIISLATQAKATCPQIYQKKPAAIQSTCSSTRRLKCISCTAFFTKWWTSSWLPDEYHATPDCSRRQSYAFESLLMINFLNRRPSMPCRASLQSKVFRKNRISFVSDIGLTMPSHPRAVSYERQTNSRKSSGNAFLTVYPFPNMSEIVDRTRKSQRHAFLALEHSATSPPSCFHAEHDAWKAPAKLPWTRPSGAWTSRGWP